MSQQDRDKWNARYRDGAYAERHQPSALLAEWVPRVLDALPEGGPRRPRALDLACGAGRNAVWLAEQGFAVDAVDVAVAGLERARARAAERGVTVRWYCHDLDAGLPPDCGSQDPDGYDLIVAMRFLDRALFASLPARLRPGGWLICEVHLQTDADVIGPRDPAFRAARGELAALFAGLAVEARAEGLFEDPDGRTAALARIVARRAD
jgi:SAM-dependent methyltransferase